MVEMEDKIKVRSSKKTKRFKLVVLSILLFCAVGPGTSVIGYFILSADYRGDMALAQKGIQHLRTAEALLTALPQNPFGTNIVNQVHNEFAAALTNFSQVNAGLKSLPEMSIFIPVYGTRLKGAMHLVPLAIDVSQAGLAGSDILQILTAKFHDPLQTRGTSLTMTEFTRVDQDYLQAKGAVTLAIDEADQLQVTDLQFDPRLAKLFTTFYQDIPMLQAWMKNIEHLLGAAPALLGINTPANYLVEVLDTTELRPAGGFIGNYGIATLSGGRLTAASITDVDLLDQPFYEAGKRIPYPEAYHWFSNYLAPNSWSLRDSNLDADFPTAARYAELNFTREGGSMPISGVIAITPALIQHMLAITGPIRIPEYHETVTAENLIDRIHYHQLAAAAGIGADTVPAPDGHSSLRKHFTAILAELFMDRVRQLPASDLPELLHILINAMSAKDIQVYFNSGTAESLLQRYHLDGAIASPTNDSLFIVDANVSANKANYFIFSTLNDQVTLDEEGNAVHQTTLSYAWNRQGHFYGNPSYKDYVRVYVPIGSILHFQNGWKPIGTSEAFGRSVWIGDFSLRFGQKLTITLLWTDPVGADGAIKDANGWHYQYLIQRQAGALRTVHLRILPPSCVARASVWGGLVYSVQQGATFTQSLDEDSNVGMNYAC